ncbi:MAG: hypothetical protein ACRDLF_10260 [Solirubrobacteraceae bacterium]
MLKRQVEIGGEYAWQEQYSFSPNEYRKVTLLKFLDKPGGRHALVRDEDGEFETHLGRLIKPWSALGPKGKESEFRTRAEKYEHERRLAQERDPVGFEIEERWQAFSPFEPGKGGVPRVPEWLPRLFNDMASGILKLEMGRGVVEDEQMACYRMLQNMAEVCESIRNVAREMLPAWEAEDNEAQYPGGMSEKVRRRLDDGDLPFASSEIMPVYANYGMSRSRATTQYYTGSIAAADFMERVADDYEELDRYASLAVRWGWGFYLRWRTAHEAEMRRAVPRTERRPGRRR